jgi:hypothetical protein
MFLFLMETPDTHVGATTTVGWLNLREEVNEVQTHHHQGRGAQNGRGVLTVLLCEKVLETKQDCGDTQNNN